MFPQNPRSKFAWLVAGGLLLTVFVWSYWSTITDLVAVWLEEPDYSHGFLVVPVAAWFLWLRRERFPSSALRPSWLGLMLIVAAVGVRFVGDVYYMTPMDGWSIMLWTAGAVWLLGGARLLRWSLPSVLFLFFMVPWPYRVERWLRVPLQKMSADVSTWILQCFGQSALAEGNTVALGEHQLEVAQACSGMRIFVGILALAFALTVIRRSRHWEKILIFASAVPIAILANSIRIVSTGLLLQYGTAEDAFHFAHDVSGWVMMPAAAIFLGLFVWFLGRLVQEVKVMDIGEVLHRDIDGVREAST